MSDLLRDEIKYVRDAAKSQYKEKDECFICGSEENLQLHHLYSLTELWNKFKKKIKADINNVEDILVYRDQFISAHHKEVYEDVLVLCKSCHMDKLHNIYGKKPSLATAEKQRRWAQKQRDKRLNNGDS